MRSDTRTITIANRPEVVYDYVCQVETWPTYSMFAQAVEKDGDAWQIQSPQGLVKLTPAFDRERLLLDHTVSPAPGVELFIPFRVVPNGEDAELMITIFQPPGLSDAHYTAQIGWIEVELQRLRDILTIPPLPA